MSELGEWVVVPGFDEALQRVIAQQTDPLVESIGELRLICDRLLARVENVENRVRTLEAAQRISYTEPPEFVP